MGAQHTGRAMDCVLRLFLGGMGQAFHPDLFRGARVDRSDLVNFQTPTEWRITWENISRIFLICFLVHFMSALLVDLCVSVDEAEKERQHGLTSKLLSILVQYV